jgi:hypothetical protein
MAAVHRSMTSSLNEGRRICDGGLRSTGAKGNFGSSLDRTFKHERLRFNPRREVAALVFSMVVPWLSVVAR